MKAIVMDSQYCEIPKSSFTKMTKCICVTFSEDDGIVHDVMFLTDETWKEQHAIYDKIFRKICSDWGKDLFLIRTRENIGPFTRTQEKKGVWGIRRKQLVYVWSCES